MPPPAGGEIQVGYPRAAVTAGRAAAANDGRRLRAAAGKSLARSRDPGHHARVSMLRELPVHSVVAAIEATRQQTGSAVSVVLQQLS